MFSKLRLSKLGLASCAVVLLTLLVGSFVHSDYLPAIFLFTTAVLTCLAFAIQKNMKLCLSKGPDTPTKTRQWRMLFFTSVSIGFCLIFFLATFIAPNFSELLGICLLFSLPCAMYFFLASQSSALKSIKMETYYWIGGVALHSSVFFMLRTLEMEFYSAVLFLFIASIATILTSFIYPHLKSAISHKENLPYLVCSAGFTLLVSYSAVVTLLRNYKTISIGYQFMDFALITIFYAVMIIGMDLEANSIPQLSD